MKKEKEYLESKLIEDVQSLSRLAGAWGDLRQAVGHPFQELGWYTAWARTIGATGGRRLKLMTLWDADRLLAVWPLSLRRFKGIRLLEWVGARVTDYCDVVVAPRVDATDALQILWRELQRKVGFDVLRLGQVRADARISAFLDAQGAWVETREAAFGIPLTWASGADWLASRSAKRRDDARRRLRQMRKNGFEFKVWQSPEAPVLEALIEQKQAWVRARDLASFVTDPQGPEFVHAMAREMSAQGLLHLSAVCSAQRIVACHVGFVRGDTFYFYMPTYDAAFAKQGFGNSLREFLIMSACDQGLKKFDMLLGAAGYKQQYDAVEEPVRTVVLPRGIIGRAAVAYYRRSVARAAVSATGASPSEAA
ncbi:MAG: GNAT family N-acetyltransferase [Steroidobacteraceae bacterium]